jgi:hypothetical protein
MNSRQVTANVLWRASHIYAKLISKTSRDLVEEIAVVPCGQPFKELGKVRRQAIIRFIAEAITLTRHVTRLGAAADLRARPQSVTTCLR